MSVNHTDVFPIPASNTADVDTMDLDMFAPAGKYNDSVKQKQTKIFTDHCEAICSTGYSLFVDDFQVFTLYLSATFIHFPIRNR